MSDFAVLHVPHMLSIESRNRNAQFRTEQFAGEIMDTMAEARYFAEEWKAIYNHERPHGSLDGMTPNRYWENWMAKTQLVIA